MGLDPKDILQKAFLEFLTTGVFFTDTYAELNLVGSDPDDLLTMFEEGWGVDGEGELIEP